VWVTAAALIAATVAALRAARRAPYVTVGWSWYLVTLLPVIGIVQVGTQAMADRYVYVPAIGLFLAAAWGAAALAWRPKATRVLAAAAVAALLVLAVRASAQVRVWHDSLSLFRATIQAVPDSWVAHYNLGNALTAAGRTAEAEAEFRETIRLRPRFARALQQPRRRARRPGPARGGGRRLRGGHPRQPRPGGGPQQPRNRAGRDGTAGRGRGIPAKGGGAATEFVEAYLNLGIVLRRRGRLGESSEALSRAVTLRPDFDLARFHRAITALQGGDEEGARRDLDVLRGRDPNLAARLAAALEGGGAPPIGTPAPAPARPRTR
jgi:tetratricopeptide (TPR) repeat protein